MEAKEKAKGLVLKFAFKGAQHEGEAKQFALIAVDEILKSLSNIKWSDEENINFSHFFDYWYEVKTELKKNYETRI